jgi:hypothetical protein
MGSEGKHVWESKIAYKVSKGSLAGKLRAGKNPFKKKLAGKILV